MKIFNAMDYFPSMAQAILASDEMIKKNPKLIQGLVRATLKGLKMIMDDPAAAAAEYVKAVPRWKVGPMTGTFKLYNQYTYPGQKVLGEMDEARLAKLQDFLPEIRLHQEEVRREGSVHEPVREIARVAF